MRNIKYRIIAAVIVPIALIGFLLAFCFNDKEYTITVTDKERIVESNDEEVSSKYLVWGENEDGEILVFQNSDEWIRGKWNSSTIQGSLQEGNTYRIIVIGFRIPFLSCYENIIHIEEMGEEK